MRFYTRPHMQVRWDLAYATWRRRRKIEEITSYTQKKCKSENGNGKGVQELLRQIYTNDLEKITKENYFNSTKKRHPCPNLEQIWKESKRCSDFRFVQSQDLNRFRNPHNMVRIWTCGYG